MLIVNFILFTLFIYIIIYSIYTLTLSIKAFGAKEYMADTRALLESNSAQNKLCVLIWACAGNKRLYDLLKILDNQSYNKSDYEVHVVFKKDKEDISIPEYVYGAAVHCIENPEYFSKDKALTLFIEKVVPEKKFDAYVFLGADRMVDENYLSYVNKSVYSSCVLSGRLNVTVSGCEFLKQLKCQVLRAYLKYQNRVHNLARAMFDMPVFIDGSNCVISADILEKTGRVCIETKNDEMKFSLFLASNSIKPTFSPFIQSCVDVENYDASTPTLKQKIMMFKYYLPISMSKPWNFKEFVFFNFRPDTLGIMALYCLLLICAFKYYTFFELKFTFHLGVLLILNLILGTFAARLNFKERIYLAFYPACIFWQRAKIFTKKISLMWIESRIHEEENVNSATVNSVVSDGKKDVLCKLVLVSEDGMRKVVFRCGKRHVTTDSYIRMYDAIGDMSNRLKSKGYTLKICQNCGNFCSVPDGTVDLLKGECQAASPDENSTVPTLIWNTCPNFINLEIKGIIDNITNKGVEE